MSFTSIVMKVVEVELICSLYSEVLVLVSSILISSLGIVGISKESYPALAIGVCV